MTYKDNILVKLFQKKEKEDKQNIRVMVEATTCTAAYVEDDICTEKRMWMNWIFSPAIMKTIV